MPIPTVKEQLEEARYLCGQVGLMFDTPLPGSQEAEGLRQLNIAVQHLIVAIQAIDANVTV